jgi:hypothetical protein
MRFLQLFAMTACILVAVSCRKQQSQSTDPIISAHAYFDQFLADDKAAMNSQNHRALFLKELDWSHASVEHFSTVDAIVVPIIISEKVFVSTKSVSNAAFKLDDLMKVIIVRKGDGFYKPFLMTFLPDSMNSTGAPSGTMLLEDWHGNTIRPAVTVGKSSNSGADPSKTVDSYTTIQTCIEIDGYNYSVNDPDDGEYWTETSCSSYGYYVYNPVLVDITAAQLLSLTQYVTTTSYHLIIPPPGNPISDIGTYFACFTNGSSIDHTYSVQVCVDQPIPGSREAWGFSSSGSSGSSSGDNPVNTGHSFLIFSENSQGYIISRSVGFYPSCSVAPISLMQSCQGVLNNDQVHDYNISLTVNLTSDQFFKMLNYAALGNNPGFYYNLNTNNCTTFVIRALSAGGISLPATVGSWPNGAGNDPGDLGEDIRKMLLTSKMTRNTVDSPHPNTGSCD